MGPNDNHKCPYKREAEGCFLHIQTNTHREGRNQEQGSHKPRDAGVHQKLREQTFSQSLQREWDPGDTFIWPSDANLRFLQNCERIVSSI